MKPCEPRFHTYCQQASMYMALLLFMVSAVLFAQSPHADDLSGSRLVVLARSITRFAAEKPVIAVTAEVTADIRSDDPLNIFYTNAFNPGETNCEFCLDNARWIAEYLNATDLYVPICYGTHHTNGLVVPLLSWFTQESTGRCCNKDFNIRHWNPRNNSSDGTRIDEMPCIELSEGRCSEERQLMGGNINFTSISRNLTSARSLGIRVFVAGVFDFQPFLSMRVPVFETCVARVFQDSVLNAALAIISKTQGLDPDKALCVHWRGEDFIEKGNPFVSNISYATAQIIKQARVDSLTQVLLLGNDPTTNFENTRLKNLTTLLRHANLGVFQLQHERSKHPESIPIDKVACAHMKGFLGTQGSTFSDSITWVRNAVECPLGCNYTRDALRFA